MGVAEPLPRLDEMKELVEIYRRHLKEGKTMADAWKEFKPKKGAIVYIPFDEDRHTILALLCQEIMAGDIDYKTYATYAGYSIMPDWYEREKYGVFEGNPTLCEYSGKTITLKKVCDISSHTSILSILKSGGEDIDWEITRYNLTLVPLDESIEKILDRDPLLFEAFQREKIWRPYYAVENEEWSITGISKLDEILPGAIELSLGKRNEKEEPVQKGVYKIIYNKTEDPPKTVNITYNISQWDNSFKRFPVE